MGLIFVDDRFKELIKELYTYDIGIEVCIFRDGVWRPVTVPTCKGIRALVYKGDAWKI